MILTLIQLKNRALQRPEGYLEDVISRATPLGHETYELSNEVLKELSVKYRKPMGLGDAVKTMIHAAIDMAPLSQDTKTKVKGCGACAKRAARLNEMIPNIGIKQD